MLYTFTATNRKGETLPWYFDSEEQVNRAYGYAFAHRNITRPTAPREASEVPKDDFVTDSGDFARWVGDDWSADGLADGSWTPVQVLARA